MSENISLRKNPSRLACEDIIKRILMTEVLEKGKNEHFKSASDFLSYFESLYPASESLTKQVQRAVKAMDMPKDSNGFFIINKTTEQLDQEEQLKFLLQNASASMHSLEECETLFLKADVNACDYLIHTIESSITFENKYETIVPTSNGILFYTKNKSNLEKLLASLLKTD